MRCQRLSNTLEQNPWIKFISLKLCLKIDIKLKALNWVEKVSSFWNGYVINFPYIINIEYFQVLKWIKYLKSNVILILQIIKFAAPPEKWFRLNAFRNFSHYTKSQNVDEKLFEIFKLDSPARSRKHSNWKSFSLYRGLCEDIITMLWLQNHLHIHLATFKQTEHFT